MAGGWKDPDLKDGGVGTAGRVRPLSSRLKLTCRGAFKKWKVWSLDIKNASWQTVGFGRDAYPRAPARRDPSNSHRVWKLRALAYGLSGTPVACRISLQKYLLNSAE